MDWSTMVVPELRDLKPYQPGITEEKLQREFGLTNICKFSSNETSIEPSPAVEAAMLEALKKANRYPDQQALLDGLASRMGVSSGNILLGNGSIDVIEALVRTFVSGQNNVILSHYGYSAYKAFVTAQGAEMRIAKSADNFGHEVDNLLSLIDANTRMILVDNPTNLSGANLNLPELKRFIDAIPEHVILILDEAYIEFVTEGYSAQSAALPLHHKNVVVTRTFSKAYGLAGMRVGYAIADSEIVRSVSRIRPPFPVSRVSLAGALAALDDSDHLQRIVDSACQVKVYLTEVLRSVGISVLDSHTNFVLCDFSSASRRVYEGLLARGMITRAMSSYGLPNHIRISIGSREEILQLEGAIRTLLSEAEQV